MPPPGVGLKTVTCAVPALVKSVAGICAVSCVALTKVVARLLPFQRTTEPLMKPVPLTVKVMPELPAFAVFGLRLAIAGAGLLMLKVCTAVTPPPGVGAKTVTCAVPALARSLAGICAVNCVALTKVVVRSLPFQRTLEVETKFAPVAVRVKAAPPTIA